jgi:phenylpropionate dioxygenase-like ring-hydroxylating dioxygenase large terminal subunit
MATVGHQYLTQWLGDWLFVGDGDTTLEDDLGDLGPLLYGLSQRITARHGFDLMAMPCAWNVAVENTLEDYHVESVHRDTFGKMGMKREGMEQHGPHSCRTPCLRHGSLPHTWPCRLPCRARRPARSSYPTSRKPW